MSAQHTPGPWTAELCYRSGFTVWGGTKDAPFPVVDTQDEEGRFGAIRGEKAEANARLIAAAPDLLAVCKRIKAHGTVSSAWIDELDAAIAKAQP
jgi:hypothetical protein